MKYGKTQEEVNTELTHQPQLALYQSIETGPDPLSQIERMGSFLAKSGMFGCTKVEQGIVLAMACVTHGMTPIEVSNKYWIIDGKLSRKAGSALAEFKRLGGKYTWEKTGMEPTPNPDDREAVGVFELDGETVRVSMTMADAKTAGLFRKGSAWEKQPDNMLRARVSSKALGMLAPEIYYGDDEPTSFASGRETESLLKNANPPENETENENEKPIEVTIDPAPSTVEPSPRETVNRVSVDQSVEQAPEAKEANLDTRAGPSLSTEQCLTVAKVIRGHEQEALTYLRSLGWLKADEGIDYLSPANFRQMTEGDAPERFLNAIKTVY